MTFANWIYWRSWSISMLNSYFESSVATWDPSSVRDKIRFTTRSHSQTVRFYARWQIIFMLRFRTPNTSLYYEIEKIRKHENRLEWIYTCMFIWLKSLWKALSNIIKVVVNVRDKVMDRARAGIHGWSVRYCRTIVQLDFIRNPSTALGRDKSPREWEWSELR